MTHQIVLSCLAESIRFATDRGQNSRRIDHILELRRFHSDRKTLFLLKASRGIGFEMKRLALEEDLACGQAHGSA